MSAPLGVYLMNWLHVVIVAFLRQEAQSPSTDPTPTIEFWYRYSKPGAMKTGVGRGVGVLAFASPKIRLYFQDFAVN
jgi:hypothetical protein